MNQPAADTCPLGLRLFASLIGGTIGAINPMLQSFDSSGYVNLSGLSFSGAASHFEAGGLFMAFYMIIPCLLANTLTYPWLYREIRQTLRLASKPKLFRIALNFSLMVTTAAVIFLATETTLLAAFENNRLMPWFGYIGLFGASAFSFGFMTIFFVPIMLIAGYLYTLANYYYIKKHYHPNAKANP